MEFQSTLSARRATIYIRICYFCNQYFNPRSPRGERPGLECAKAARGWFQSTLSARRATFCVSGIFNAYAYFNPRSPRGERQYKHLLLLLLQPSFQSTLSARRATCSDTLKSKKPICSISIHALREESDLWMVVIIMVNGEHFNPRSPRGERPDYSNRSALDDILFQSTLSARRATAKSNIIFTLKSTMYLHFFTKL